jgi:hypothetical protein
MRACALNSWTSPLFAAPRPRAQAGAASDVENADKINPCQAWHKGGPQGACGTKERHAAMPLPLPPLPPLPCEAAERMARSPATLMALRLHAVAVGSR